MAENNSSAPLKTAEVTYPDLPAGTYASAYSSEANVFSAEEMRAYAAQAVEAQAPAAVAVPPSAYVNAAGITASDKPGTVVRKLDAAFHDAVTFKDATPELPATEDSSAGDLVEVQATTYVQPVPDHCDRIVWRRQYIHLPKAQAEPLCWVFEDELPASLTTEAYNALFAHSKVDGVRMFPVFGPQPSPQAQPADALDAAWSDLKVAFDIGIDGDDSLWAANDADDLRLPEGWELIETTISGCAGFVAIFRVAHLPSGQETQEVRTAIDAAMAAAQEGGKA